LLDAASIKAARLDRLETYDQNFRLWHWRLAAEQLIYSHDGDGPNGQRLYKSNSTRMMLMCGEEDDFTGANIWQRDAEDRRRHEPHARPGDLHVEHRALAR